ncbi:putative inositol monophosphatase [Erysiphe necator]|uniref:Inositol-1-monophosphatase n=1 Tax=Uncinula necator TaxID=52586 RepID=A0A0B1PCQ4_UNCNE|nr:putative inositol monophosphatase [Erysiphe necator]
MLPSELEKIHDLMVSIAYEAGGIMTSAKPSHSTSGTKKNSTDIVTETDRFVEKHVSTRLLSAFPDFKFIGEETYYPGQKLTDEPTFIVDPIDGTTNFVHNFPAFCISLGLTVKKVPVVGVIYNPRLDHLYTAIQGQGAYLQKEGMKRQKLPLKEAEPLNDLSTCLIGTGWGCDRTGTNYDLKCKTFRKLAASKEDGGAMVHGMRSIGSAALNLAAVAAGQQDIFWECGCWAWDVCAGWCILVETGGTVVSGNPGEWDCKVESRKYLAVRGAPSGQKEIVEEFWKIIGDERLDYSS